MEGGGCSLDEGIAWKAHAEYQPFFFWSFLVCFAHIVERVLFCFFFSVLGVEKSIA
jgi:hypothetical protein